ncbi:MAG: hypothetical protein RL410_533 [Actinomycetota bacterium]|jgi:hypothetical protein
MKRNVIFALLGLSLFEMAFGSFRYGAGSVAAAMGYVLFDRIRKPAQDPQVFAVRNRGLDILMMSFLFISLTILAIVVPTPQ